MQVFCSAYAPLAVKKALLSVMCFMHSAGMMLWGSCVSICIAGLKDRAVQAVAPTSPESRPIISVKRLISCPTYCSRLHVNQHMAEHLLPVLPEAACIKVSAAAFTLTSLSKITG